MANDDLSDLFSDLDRPAVARRAPFRETPMCSTPARDDLCRMARKNPAQALADAQEIHDPWLRCKALAHAARYSSEDQFHTIIEMAFTSAMEAEDPYKAVAVSAWPARATIERQHPEILRPKLPGLLEQAVSIASHAGRSEALFRLFQAVHPGPADMRAEVFRALVQASVPSVHWRQGRNMRDAVLMLGRVDRPLAEEGYLRMEENQWRRQAARAIAERSWRQPREFFY